DELGHRDRIGAGADFAVGDRNRAAVGGGGAVFEAVVGRVPGRVDGRVEARRGFRDFGRAGAEDLRHRGGAEGHVGAHRRPVFVAGDDAVVESLAGRQAGQGAADVLELGAVYSFDFVGFEPVVGRDPVFELVGGVDPVGIEGGIELGTRLVDAG